MAILILLLVSLTPDASPLGNDPTSAERLDPVRSALGDLERRFAEIENVYAEYEVWMVDKAHKTDERKLRVWEAMDRDRKWKRTLHFYRELYDNTDHPDYDPSFNWILWSPESEIHFVECTRYAYIKPTQPVAHRVPSIDGYLAYLGLAYRDQRIDAPAEGVNSNPWNPSDYFFPDAVRKQGWQIAGATERSESNGLKVLERKEGFGTDLIWLDPERGHALVRREIRHPDGRLNLRLSYGRLTEVGPRCWLPREVLVENHGNVATRCVVNRLEVNAREFASTSPTYPPGTVIIDERKSSNTILPGGDELLDFTIARTRFFMQQNPDAAPKSGMTPSLAALTGLLSLGIVFYAGARLLRHRSPQPSRLVDSSSS